MNIAGLVPWFHCVSVRVFLALSQTKCSMLTCLQGTPLDTTRKWKRKALKVKRKSNLPHENPTYYIQKVHTDKRIQFEWINIFHHVYAKNDILRGGDSHNMLANRIWRKKKLCVIRFVPLLVRLTFIKPVAKFYLFVGSCRALFQNALNENVWNWTACGIDECFEELSEYK